MFYLKINKWSGGETGIHEGLKIPCRKACGFDSHPDHFNSTVPIFVGAVFLNVRRGNRTGRSEKRSFFGSKNELARVDGLPVAVRRCPGQGVEPIVVGETTSNSHPDHKKIPAFFGVFFYGLLVLHILQYLHYE